MNINDKMKWIVWAGTALWRTPFPKWILRKQIVCLKFQEKGVNDSGINCRKSASIDCESDVYARKRPENFEKKNEKNCFLSTNKKTGFIDEIYFFICFLLQIFTMFRFSKINDSYVKKMYKFIFTLDMQYSISHLRPYARHRISIHLRLLGIFGSDPGKLNNASKLC